MAAAAPAGRRITSNKDQAGFVPIPPDIDVDGVIRDTANFKSVARIDALTLATDEDFEHVKNLIQNEVVKEGMPLVIENWHRRGDWPKWIFDPSWLRKNYGNAVINVRDIPNKKEIPMTYDHYLKNMPKLAGRFQAASFSKHQRLYAKDLDCPIIWRERLGEVIPPSTFYLNPEADLMSSLPHEARAENMMCYIGHEGTYTPAHKEMCASLGQNIMVHASEGAEQPGSSIWFMTRTKDRKAVAEYWLSSLGHDIEVEAHFASVADLQEAPFDVYIHEQKLGDYILVPPLAPHQVWNRGVTTIKAAWNRTTVDTLKHAMEEALPNARLVCRDEQYKNRDIIHDTLRKYTRILRGVEPQGELEIDKIQRDYVKLFKLFHKIVVNEMFSPTIDQPPVENIPREYNVQCSFCRGNIWNRFLSCKNCIIKDEDDGEDSAYDICLDCYARGRSCFCVSKLDWVQQHVWADLEEEHEEFRRQVISFNDIDAIVNAPSSLSVALDRLGEKTLAWVCQEQLLVRPWVDLTKNGLEEEEQDDEDSVQKKKRMGLSINCHVCKIRHDTWKSVKCSTCEKSYCYGNLWRAFDQDPFDDILKKFRWDCPVCELKCSCGACRKRPDMNPYMPKGTFLGAPTKHVADPRSTESLVDFARGNLNWIKDTGSGQGLINLKRKRGSLDLESEVFENGDSHAPVQEPAHGQEERSRQIPIDPALDIGISNGNANGTNNGNDFTPVNGASNEGRFPSGSNHGASESHSNALGSPQVIGRQTSKQQKSPSEAPSEAPSEVGRHEEERDVPGDGDNDDGSGVLPIQREDIPPELTSSYFNPTLTSSSSNALHTQTSLTSLTPTGAWTGAAGPEPPSGEISGDHSTLELNPLAFMAAAGLRAAEASSSNTNQQPDAWQQLQPGSVDSHTATTTTNNKLMSPHHLSLTTAPAMTPPPPRPPLPMRTHIRPDIAFPYANVTPAPPTALWVKKTQDALRRTKNLRKKRKLIVVLRPPLLPFRALIEKIEEEDLVTSNIPDFMGISPTADPTDNPDDSNYPIDPLETGKPNRGRPRGFKSKSTSRSLLDTDEIHTASASEEEHTTVSREEAAKRKARRRSAYARRQAEEAAELARLVEEEARRGGVILTGKGRNQVGSREVREMLGGRPETEDQRRVREEREEATRLAKAKAEEEKRIAREKAAEAAAEMERERQKERRRAKIERKQQRQEEANRRREQERVERKLAGDRMAKMIASGLCNSSDAEDDYESPPEEEIVTSSDSEAESEPEPEPELVPNHTAWIESMTDFEAPPDDILTYATTTTPAPFKIPENWDFAVVVALPSTPDWRAAYICSSTGKSVTTSASIAGRSARSTVDPLPFSAIMNASSAAPGHFPALSLSPSSTAGVVAPPPKRPRGRPRKNTLPGTVSAPTTVRKPAAKPRTAPATTVKRTPAAARKQTTTTGNTPTTWRKRSTAPDASFRTDTRHITHTSIPTDAPRQKRLSALGAGLRGYRNDGLSDLDNALEEMERQKNKSKKVKKVLVKKVEVAPGRWAEVEISDDSDEEMLSGDAQDMRKNDVEEEAGKEEEEAQAGTEEVGEMMMADMIDIDKDMDEEFGARWQRRRTAGWW